MAPRRAHKKSRFGCDQCKRRRVKCDEGGPPCTNCVNRELPCRYPITPPAFNHSTNTTSASSTPSTNSTSPSTATISSQLPLPSEAALSSDHGSNDLLPATTPLSANRRLRELELMHKFTSETYKSICGIPTDPYAWQTVLPRKALTHDFLMNGILALASLHIATGLDDAAMAKSYVDGALEYHSLTFLPFRKALDNITPANCEAVFAFSIITTILGIALPRLTLDKPGTGNMMEHILAIFELLQGTRKIFLAGRAWLEAGCFSVSAGFWNNASGNVDEGTRAAIKKLKVLNHERLAKDDERYHFNIHLLARLEYCFSGFSETRDISTAMAWLAILDKNFIQEFRHGEPLCVLMFMHWGVLLHELENHTWWPMGSGKALVTELLDVLQAHHSLEEFTLWPRQQIGSPIG